MAVTRAATTIKGVRQADVVHVTALVEDGEVSAWRVKVHVTFAVQDQVHE